MKICHMFYHGSKSIVILDARHIQPGVHDLFNGDIAEFEDSLENVLFFLGGGRIYAHFDGFIDFLVVNCTTASVEELGFNAFAYAYVEVTHRFKGSMNDADKPGKVGCKADVVLGSPHPGKYLSEEEEYEGDDRNPYH